MPESGGRVAGWTGSGVEEVGCSKSIPLGREPFRLDGERSEGSGSSNIVST